MVHSPSRDARLLIAGALLALLATVAGFVAAVWLASAAEAGSCVGAWRVTQWEAAIAETGVMWEPPRPGLVNKEPCLPVQAPSAVDGMSAPPVPLYAPHIPSVEQWRPLVAEYFHTPQAIDDALLVITRESGGCVTAAHGYGCVGGFIPRQNSWGCQARGLFQHCLLYWGERASGGCVADESVIDPRCNVETAHAMWVASGCSFRSHWPATAVGTARGC